MKIVEYKTGVSSTLLEYEWGVKLIFDTKQECYIQCAVEVLFKPTVLWAGECIEQGKDFATIDDVNKSHTAYLNRAYVKLTYPVFARWCI